MHDLAVAARPVPADVPIDVVIVRSPSSMVPVVVGTVLIQHRSTTGAHCRAEAVERACALGLLAHSLRRPVRSSGRVAIQR